MPAEGGQGPDRAGNGIESLHRWQHTGSNTDELGREDRLRKGPGFVWVTHGGGTTWEEGLVGGVPPISSSPSAPPDARLPKLLSGQGTSMFIQKSHPGALQHSKIPFQYPLSILPLHSRDHLRPPLNIPAPPPQTPSITPKTSTPITLLWGPVYVPKPSHLETSGVRPQPPYPDPPQSPPTMPPRFPEALGMSRAPHRRTPNLSSVHGETPLPTRLKHPYPPPLHQVGRGLTSQDPGTNRAPPCWGPLPSGPWLRPRC